jgi:putative oxidoreductase
MLVALTMQIKKGFLAQNGGYEYALLLGVAALSFAFTGPGSLSLDALFGNHFSGIFCGIAALLVDILGGVFSLIQRRPTSAQQTEIVN